MVTIRAVLYRLAFMKFSYLLLIAISVVACKPYAVEQVARYPVPEKYLYADKPSNRLMSVKQFPRRIKRSELFKHSRFATDTVEAYRKRKELSLFVNAGYSREKKCGYLISVHRGDTAEKRSYVCVLFEIAGNKLESSTYYFESAAGNFREAKLSLTSENQRLFGGRIATKKEMKRDHRKRERAVKKKAVHG